MKFVIDYDHLIKAARNVLYYWTENESSMEH